MDKLFELLAGLPESKKAEIFDGLIDLMETAVNGESLFREKKEPKKRECSSSCSSTPYMGNNNIYNNTDNHIIDDTTTATTTTLRNNEICAEWLKTYTEICRSYPRPARLTEKRKSAILNRINVDGFTLEDFRAACRNMEASEWMKGKSWSCFDWIVASADNLAKLAEGYYNRRCDKAPEPKTEEPPLEGRLALLEQQIRETAHHFGKDVDSRSMAADLKKFMDHDKYYKRLEDRDIVRVFHYGSARRDGYEYFGEVNAALFCKWFQTYKPMWLEERRSKV